MRGEAAMPEKTNQLWWIILLTTEASVIAESIGDSLVSSMAGAAALGAAQQLGIPDMVVHGIARDIASGREPSLTPWRSGAKRRNLTTRMEATGETPSHSSAVEAPLRRLVDVDSGVGSPRRDTVPRR